MSTWVWILLVGSSILLNGFYAGMETGITSSRRVRLVHWARQGRRGAELAARLVRRRERSVVAAVVGNNVAVVTGTALATAWAVQELGSRGETVAAVSMAALNIVFGEILPKTAFRARPEKLIVPGAAFFQLSATLLRPLEFLATSAAKLVLALLGERGAHADEALTRGRLLQLFALSRERRELDPSENRLLTDFVAHSHRSVADVMTPWERVARVPADATVREVFEQVRVTGHSRLPAVRPDGSLFGLLLYRDLQGLPPDADCRSKVRDFIRIPAWMAIDEALGVLADRQVSLAVVTGPDRIPEGVVTLEDLLEPFVGDILDEHDETGIPNNLR